MPPEVRQRTPSGPHKYRGEHIPVNTPCPAHRERAAERRGRGGRTARPPPPPSEGAAIPPEVPEVTPDFAGVPGARRASAGLDSGEAAALYYRPPFRPDPGAGRDGADTAWYFGEFGIDGMSAALTHRDAWGWGSEASGGGGVGAGVGEG
jgi:hypothetical protein